MKLLKNPVFYQIFVQSFADSNGDGWGDLQGIIQRLPYIADLGVDGIWLTPIYQSPLHDNGYDVANYRKINPRYGTMEDAEKLIFTAHSLGLRVIFDLVVNHTSTEHEWFQKSRQKIEPYTDYYIWKPQINDWDSKFGGSAWEFDSLRGEYYLHLFAKQQADLNWENPRVRGEVKDIIRFWAQKGIDGLRLDVINLISKDQSFPGDPDTHGQKYYTDGPRVKEFFSDLGAVFEEFGLITVGELSSSDISHSADYTNPANKMLTSVFSFKHLSADWADLAPGQYLNTQLAKLSAAPFSLLKMKQIINNWQAGMLAEGGVLSPCWGNHDQPRIVSRFGNDSPEFREISAKMLCIGQMFLSGIPFIFQGEELAMTNYPFRSLEEFRDVETLGAINILREAGSSNILGIIKKISRENSFSPMQWDEGDFAGFSKEKSWRPINPNHKTINAKAQKNDENSVFSFYKEVLRLRKKFSCLYDGSYTDLCIDNPDVWCYTREKQGEKLLISCNFSSKSQEISLPQLASAQRIAGNYPAQAVREGNLSMRPYEGIVFKESI